MDLQCKFNLISCLLNWYGRGMKSFGSNWIFSAKVLRHCFIQLTENCKRNDIKERKKTESCLTFFSYKLAITWIFSPINRTVTVCFVSPKISQLKTAIDRHFNKYLEFASLVSFSYWNREANKHLRCNSV